MNTLTNSQYRAKLEKLKEKSILDLKKDPKKYKRKIFLLGFL
jgi:hypothetical protein